jgi:CheY-like chemotaxis protein
MFSKERLSKISELNSEKIMQLGDGEVISLATNVHSLIDGFPTQEEIIKNALKENQRDAMTAPLTSICGMLQQIHADTLADMCNSHIGKLNEASQESLQAFVINLLKAVSSLSIDLQMIEYQSASDAPTKTGPDISNLPEEKNSILAVDDTIFFLQMIKNMLKDTDYKVTCMSSGEAAMNYLSKHRPAMFILDIDMPGMDGYELARKIKAMGHTAPIVFLTGNAKKDYVVKALQVGAADFIIKPVNAVQLLERVNKHIKPEPTGDDEDDDE